MATTLSIDPSSLSVRRGGVANFSVQVSGASGPVSLSESGLPSGVTVTFDPQPTEGQSTLACATDARMKAGSYGFTVSGDGASVSGTLNVK